MNIHSGKQTWQLENRLFEREYLVYNWMLLAVDHERLTATTPLCNFSKPTRKNMAKNKMIPGTEMGTDSLSRDPL